MHINDTFVKKNRCFKKLIQLLKYAFTSGNTIIHQRHHHDFSNPNPKSKPDSILLLMPAWNLGKNAG